MVGRQETELEWDHLLSARRLFTLCGAWCAAHFHEADQALVGIPPVELTPANRDRQAIFCVLAYNEPLYKS